VAARARRLSTVPVLSRRSLLAAAGLSGVGVLAGCRGTQRRTAPRARSAKAQRIRYGEAHGSQFAELRVPAGTSLGTVVLLHGGYWLAQYGLDLMDPLAERFTELGYATWNVEYRRTSDGGGYPHTLLDVAAAVDRLDGPGLPRGLADEVVLVGHSAGGHLAAWSASRSARTPGGVPAFPLRGAVSLSGVLDLTRAAASPASSSPVTALMGGTPEERPEEYALADPALLVPATCPVWAAQAEHDGVVPPEQSTSYVARARAAGGTAENVPLPGDHFSIISPDTSSFPTIERLVADALA
jgi:acetyl esterase/lipase